MYKVVIIDDNKNTVQSLLRSVNWNELGIEVAGTAANGVNGQKLILDTRPDIIITDIRMPFLDGLNMIGQIQDKLLNSRIIVITGYDEFQYASRAIKLSVFDFILKPIDNDELLNTIKRCIESLEKDKQISIRMEQVEEFTRRALFLTLITNTGINDNSAYFMLKDCGIENIDCFYIMALRHKSNVISQPLLRRLDEEVLRVRTIISLIVGTDLILLVTPKSETNWKKKALELASTILEKEPDLTVAVSRLHNSAYSIHEAYKEVKQLLLEISLREDGSNICFYDKSEIGKDASLSYIDQVCEQLLNSELTGQELLDNVYCTIMDVTHGEIRSMRTMLVLYCTKALKKFLVRTQWTDTMDESIYKISLINSPEDAYNCLKHFYNELDNCMQMSTGVSCLVQNVLQYISLHAIEGLRLEDVASNFYISPNYLSALVKKETGMTYQQHVLNAKLDMAKKMLDDTRMRVEEIAHAIGYENYISFYNAFKKKEGVSPTEYRFRKNS